MNILYVLPYFNPKRGGDVNVCTNLAKEFVKRGNDVTILTTDFELDAAYLDSIEEDDVNVVCSKSLFNAGLFIYSPSMKKWLKENIQRFDIIHLHTSRAYQNNIIHNYSKRYNIPYILQSHGSLVTFFQKQGLKKLYDYFWGYKILKGASNVIALTENEFEQYKTMEVPEDKIEKVPNGINLSEFKNLPERGTFRKKYSIKENEKFILYLGRLNKIKGIDLLIQSFAEISKEISNVKLVIVGPDDGIINYLKDMIRNLEISEKVLFTGPLYERNKLEAYIDADIYVLPSIYETFPITVIEAFTCDTPVIITNKCHISDLLKGKAYIVNYDKYELYKAMLNILVDEQLKNNFIKEGKKYVLTELRFDIIVNKFEKIYNEIINP